MARNVGLWTKFQQLIPSELLLIGEVLAHNADDTSTVELPGGGQLIVKGQTVAIGNNAFVQYGRVQGEAPSLPFSTVDV